MVGGLGMVIFAGLLSAGPRFDVVCRVTDYNGKLLDAPAHLRIDVDRGVYCEGRCHQVLRIVEVSASTIVLDENDVRHPARTTIKRNDAGDVTIHYSRGSHPDRHGSCKIQEFSSIRD